MKAQGQSHTARTRCLRVFLHDNEKNDDDDDDDDDDETMEALNEAGMNFLGDLGRRITKHTDDHREQ